jgi:hypothetical protein
LKIGNNKSLYDEDSEDEDGQFWLLENLLLLLSRLRRSCVVGDDKRQK